MSEDFARPDGTGAGTTAASEVEGRSSGAPFVDAKAEGALRTIGEVARTFGIKQHVLRYWEQQFPMLRPLKRSGSRRYYRPADVALVARIDRLINREGYTLKGARQVIEAKPGDAAEQPAPPPVAAAAAPSQAQKRTELLGRLVSVRERLASALEAA